MFSAYAYMLQKVQTLIRRRAERLASDQSLTLLFPPRACVSQMTLLVAMVHDYLFLAEKIMLPEPQAGEGDMIFSAGNK